MPEGSPFGSTAQGTGQTAGAGIDRERSPGRHGGRYVKPERSDQAEGRLLVLALQVFHEGGLILGIQRPALEPETNQARDLQTRPERAARPAQDLNRTRRTSAITGRWKARHEPGKNQPAERQEEREPGSEVVPREALRSLRGWVPSESFHREAHIHDQWVWGTTA
jgi:hypothetical protein